MIRCHYNKLSRLGEYLPLDRGRGTACGGRGRNSICEAHNMKVRGIRLSAANHEGITAYLLSLVLCVRTNVLGNRRGEQANTKRASSP